MHHKLLCSGSCSTLAIQKQCRSAISSITLRASPQHGAPDCRQRLRRLPLHLHVHPHHGASPPLNADLVAPGQERVSVTHAHPQLDRLQYR